MARDCSAHGLDETRNALEAVDGWLVPATSSMRGVAVDIAPVLAKWYKRQRKYAINGTQTLSHTRREELCGTRVRVTTYMLPGIVVSIRAHLDCLHLKP